jgi:malate dehydrogenase
MIIWGNHSATQYPDIHHCSVAGEAAMGLVDQDWTVNDFIPTVQQRGAAIIKARGASSAAVSGQCGDSSTCVTGRWALAARP